MVRKAAAAAADLSPNAPPPVQDTTDSPACSNYWGDHTATLSTQPKPFAKTLPWLVCGYTPQQMRQAYGADKVSQTGKGVRVGIVDTYASPTIVQDVNRYSQNHGLPPLSYMNFLQLVPAGLVNVPKSDPCDPQSWYGEETLDIEAVPCDGAECIHPLWRHHLQRSGQHGALYDDRQPSGRYYQQQLRL